MKFPSHTVSSCINRVELLESLLIPGLDRYINATSFIPPHAPSEARMSGIGWCSDDPACDRSGENQFIEVDFGAEVVVEAIAILRAGGGYVTHYSVEYTRSYGDYHCISEEIPNNIVSQLINIIPAVASYINAINVGT